MHVLSSNKKNQRQNGIVEWSSRQYAKLYITKNITINYISIVFGVIINGCIDKSEDSNIFKTNERRVLLLATETLLFNEQKSWIFFDVSKHRVTPHLRKLWTRNKLFPKDFCSFYAFQCVYQGNKRSGMGFPIPQSFEVGEHNFNIDDFRYT